MHVSLEKVVTVHTLISHAFFLNVAHVKIGEPIIGYLFYTEQHNTGEEKQKSDCGNVMIM